MSDKPKKDKFRFSISFKPEIPQHVMAAEYLNSFGRNKGYIVAKAVDYYLNNDMQKIEQIIELTVEKAISQLYLNRNMFAVGSSDSSLIDNEARAKINKSLNAFKGDN